MLDRTRIAKLRWPMDPAVIAAHNAEVDEHDAMIDLWIADGSPSPMDLARRAYETAPLAAGPEWMTTNEVAEKYRWKAKTVRKDIRAGILHAEGGENRSPYRIRSDEAQRWAVERRAPKPRTRTQRTQRTRQSGRKTTFKDMVKG